LTRFFVRLQPRAGENRVVGFDGGVLRVRVTAPAEAGRANEALVGILATTFGVAKRQIIIVRGYTARNKTVEVEGVSDDDLAGIIEALVPKIRRQGEHHDTLQRPQ
jgi:uncharacterized protein